MSSISINSLLSSIIDASNHGCITIRAVKSSDSDLSINYKIEGEKKSAVTIADVKAQHVIISSIRNTWGDELKIIGEEDNTELTVEYDLPDVPSNLEKNFELPLSRWDEGKGKWVAAAAAFPSDLNISVEELTLYVDPLDGTREFIEGRYHNVTCLIGVCHNGRPLCGVIAYPFSKETEGKTRVVYGLAAGGLGEMIMADDGSYHNISLPPQVKPNDNNKIKYATGDRPNAIISLMKTSFLTLQPHSDHLVMGAAGHKIHSVAIGDIQFAFMKNTNASWDTAAPSAILESQGGKITDWFGRPLLYKTEGDMTNCAGVVASAKGYEKIHDEFCAKLSEEDELRKIANT